MEFMYAADVSDKNAAATSPESGKSIDRGPRILSLCCLYPNRLRPNQGLFVERRLQHLGRLTELEVTAPIPIFQYGNPNGRRIRIAKREYSPQPHDSSPFVSHPHASHPRWFYPPFSGSLTSFWLFFQLVLPLARLRRRFPFAIIDTHFGHPEGITGLLLSLVLRVPFTMTLRGNEPKHSRSAFGRILMSCAIRRASRVFTVSERLRRFAISLGANPDKVKTIPNGVDTTIFFPRNRRTCRIQHGFALDRPLIVSAGALVERKGHHRIIRALHSLIANGINADLVIVGGPGPEGHYETNIRQLVSDLGLERSVRFLGPVTPEIMAEVMSAADLLCLASSNEGWPNVVHESLACGTPVVATDVGAVPEMLAGARNGLVVPAGDEGALRNAIHCALQSEWDRPAIASRGQARSWEHVAAEVLEQMQGIAAEQMVSK